METVNSEQLDWHKLRTVGELDTNVLPVAVQDADAREMIMIAYLSREALAESARTGRAVFYSTSRHQLHRKGEVPCECRSIESKRKPLMRVDVTGGVNGKRWVACRAIELRWPRGRRWFPYSSR